MKRLGVADININNININISINEAGERSTEMELAPTSVMQIGAGKRRANQSKKDGRAYLNLNLLCVIGWTRRLAKWLL
jgi:hypothetical protein